MLFMSRKVRTLRMIVHVALTVLCIITINGLYWKYYFFFVRPYTTPGNRTNIMYVRAIEKIAEPDASVAVGWAGAVPYFSQRVCFDTLGKCDAHIARLPAHPNIRRAGHNKHDLAYSLTIYKPDIVVHVLDLRVSAFGHYQPIAVKVDSEEVLFCVRKDSRKVKGGRTVGWRALGDRLQKVIDENKFF